jgi:organic radical activating enzyme
MLNNIPVASCESACWAPERNNQISRRIGLKSNKKTHIELTSVPDTINLVVGSSCNLTCSYCCKNYSTAWARDVANNGPYTIGSDRFTASTIDRLLSKVSHSEHENSTGYQLLLSELTKFNNVNTVYITGGEPFLYNSLIELVANLVDLHKQVIIYTGLGVNHARFVTIVKKLQNIKNLKIVISAENINSLYEFNRYGNKFQDLCVKVATLAEHNVPVEFATVLSNITLFGLQEFVEYFSAYKINHNICNDPDFLQVNVLDLHSKQKMLDSLHGMQMSTELQDLLSQSIQQPCTDQQKTNVASYLQEFAARRNMSLDVFPAEFTDWLY